MYFPNYLFLYTYKFFTLGNNLRTLFVNHESMKKAAVAMIIKSGLNDDTVPGVSHLIEHMLLRGSAKYPENDDDFTQFLALHNGMCNAETHNDFTIFYFNVDLNAFYEALDRFIWFFIEPTFSNHDIDGEINAIDSESKLFLEDDEWRKNRMESLFTKEYNQYGIGDNNTLRIENMLEKMKELYEKNFCTENMQIVILHPDINIRDKVNEMLGNIIRRSDSLPKTEPEDQEENGIVLFKKYQWPETTYKKHLYDDNCLKRRIYIKPIKNTHEVIINIEVPKQNKIYENDSLNYLIYLLKLCNKDSLIQRLKSKNLAYSITISLDQMLHYSKLSIKMSMSKKGINDVDNVLKIIKDYFKNMTFTAKDFDKYKEYRKKSFMLKEQKTQIEIARLLAMEMLFYPIENLLDHDYLVKDYNETELYMILEILKNVDNWLIFIITSEFETLIDQRNQINCFGDSDDKFVIQKEKYFGVEYSICDKINLSDHIKSETKSGNNYRYKGIFNDTYNSPKIYVHICFNVEIPAEDYVKTLLAVELVKDSVNEKYNEFITLSLCSYVINVTELGIKLVVSGIDNKILEVITFIVQELQDVKKDNFELVKNLLRDSFIEKEMKPAFMLKNDVFTEILLPNKLSNSKCLNQIDDVHLNDIELSNKYFIEFFVCGNVNLAHFRNYCAEMAEKFTSSNIYRPIENNFEEYKYVSKFQKQNFILVYYDFGLIDDVVNTAVMNLLLQVSAEYFFGVMRVGLVPILTS